CMQSLDFPWMF
nr:immunoglobulin light chain junction region [Macaca mulatta]